MCYDRSMKRLRDLDDEQRFDLIAAIVGPLLVVAAVVLVVLLVMWTGADGCGAFPMPSC